jgi:hypothetical protein
MKPESHKLLTQYIFDLLSETVLFFPLQSAKNKIAQQSYDTDYVKDLEFIDVEGFERDDPHKDETWAIDDHAHYLDESFYGLFGKHYFTSFNHFIDIRKGKPNAEFDDFDGYSYHRGSGSKSQYEVSKVAGVGIMKIDEAINYWLNDEYVHDPSKKWYRDCSPSTVRYSYPLDKSRFANNDDELKNRFPLAESTEGANEGIPYSVFLPVDNMARYWNRAYKNSGGNDPSFLGYVMHAIQDASIPHHAASTCGNWHQKYEEKVCDRLPGWVCDQNFREDVKALFKAWNQIDAAPPNALDVSDVSRQPHRNWNIEWLVTWMALNAFDAYTNSHQNFSNGWTDNESSMKELTKKAAALSMLALYEASILEVRYDFVPGALQVRKQQIHQGKWCVGMFGRFPGVIDRPIEMFESEAEANRCVEIVRYYGMNSQCKAGNIAYYLTDGKAPGCGLKKTLGNEQIAVFDPDKIKVEFKVIVMAKRTQYFITQDGNVVIDFGYSPGAGGAAMRLYHIIQKYQFNRYCWLGDRNSPTMQYFLQDYKIVQVLGPEPGPIGP